MRRLSLSVRATALAVAVLATPVAVSSTSGGASVRLVHAVKLGAVVPRTHLAAGVMPRTPLGTRPFSAPSGAHLTYYGGPVISNMKSVDVLWGSGSYASTVSGSYVGQFTTQFFGSGVMDWLNEYNTPSQKIGRGTFGGQYTITPFNSGSSLTDAQIQSELAAQINAGHLPAPDANTSYALFFPHGVQICNGSACSGVQFCAYHGATIINSNYVTYQVMPDQQPGSGLDTGCGGGSAAGNETSVLSHELVETITDPLVSYATTYGPPLGWYDGTNGEIGDICNAMQGTFVGRDGVTYTAQQQYSNTASDCVSTRLAEPSFTSAASLNLTKGVPATFTATATGLPLPTFSFTGALPTGMSFSNFVLSGTPTQGGTFPLTLTATNGVGVPATQNFVLTVTQSPLITSAATATFVKGVPGTFLVTGVGAPAPTFTAVGSLPPGLLLAPTGQLTGTPTTTGVFNFIVTATNGVAPNAAQPFTVRVVHLLITTATLGSATRGQSFSLQLTKLGGVPTYVWSLTSPKLPAGLVLSASGKITGKVKLSVAKGTYSVGIALHDGSKPIVNKTTATLSLVVK